MKLIQICLFMLMIISCSHKENQPEQLREVPLHLETNQVMSDHPDDFFTPNGIEVNFPVSDSSYHLVWKRNNTYDTLQLSLPLIIGGNSSTPTLIEENHDYLYFENGCGSPCWNGFILPINEDGEAKSFEYPIARDLNRHRIAVISNDGLLTILNLQNGKKQRINPDKCSSAFVGYCIDTAYFDKNEFIYIWGNDALMKSGDEVTKRVRIN